MSPEILDVVKALGPSVITVLLGAVLAAFFVPRWQNQVNRERLIVERRIKITEDVAEQFTHYVIAWRRLIAISQVEEDQLSNAQREMKAGFVADRNSHRARLHAMLYQALIYFDEDVFARLEEFMEWDNGQATREIRELPRIAQWTDWHKRVLNHLKRGLGS